MAIQTGKRAIVIGAGIGGMLFARVLADYFEDVRVLERDSLPDGDESRNGVPQGRHVHALLAGGCRAMNALLPGLVDDFKAAGAVELVAGLSMRVETPGYDPFPQRDLGFTSYGLSRPLLELCVRRRVRAIANISWEQNSVVERLLHDAGAVTGVALRDGRRLPADFVIDASRRGELTLKAFDEMGYARPRETTIGVDLRYVTALFEIPENASYGWKMLVTHPEPPPGSVKGALASTIEGNRLICGLAWRGEEKAPVDRESFIDFTLKLRTQTCYHAIKDATMIGNVASFLFRESNHRHFSELEPLPKGLLPVADAICCFNPVHGQGMSVAALEAEAFRELLESGDGDFHDLSLSFLRRTDQIIEAPWNMAAAPDLAYPDTRGDRPPNLMQLLMFGAAFMELAARDANAHKLMMEIRSLLKPYSALMSDAALMQGVQTVMAEMAQAGMGVTAAV
jgi:2-polyprenyl-6-methoxyphenol hydroxylase-like FAD-dependent oxidoreductase